MARAQKSIFNFFSSLIRTFAGMILGLVATPFVLKYLGQEKFGTFKTFGDITGYMGLLEIGLLGAILSLLSESISHQDKEQQKKVLHWGIKSFLRISLIATFIGMGLVPFLPHLVKVGFTADEYIGFIVLLMMIWLIPFQSFKAFHDANQNSTITNFSMLLYTFFFSAFSMIFAYLKPTVSGQSLASFLALFLSYLFLYWKNPFTIVSILKSPINNMHGEEKVTKTKWANFWVDLAGRVCLLSDTIVVSSILGPKLVVPFLLSQKLPQIVQAQLQNVGASVWASMGEIYHQNKMELFHLRLYEVTKILAIFSGVGLGVVFLVNQSFVGVWVGEQFYSGDKFLLIVCLNAFFLSLFVLWGWNFTATNKLTVLVPMMILQALVNIIASILCTIHFGVIGPVLGTTIAFLTVPLWWMPWELKRSFNISILKLTLSWLVPTSFFLILIGFLFYFQKKSELTLDSWPKLIFSSILLGLIFLLISYFILMNSQDRYLTRMRFQNILNKLTGKSQAQK